MEFNPLLGHWSTHLLFPSSSVHGPRAGDDSYGPTPSYYMEAVTVVQFYFDNIFFQYKCSGRDCGTDFRNVDTFFKQQFPYPPYTIDYLFEYLGTLTSLLIILSLIYPCMNTVRLIAFEKEQKLKEAMEILGLQNWLHWTAWFIHTFILVLIINSITVILLKVTKTA